MGEVFRGRKRKVGCVALLLAVAVTVLWIRSYVMMHSVAITFQGRLYGARSSNGTMFGFVCDHTDLPPTFEWQIETLELSKPGSYLAEVSRSEGLDQQTFSIEDLSFSLVGPSDIPTDGKMEVPYWGPVIVLTLIAGYLIFSESFIEKRKTIVTSVPSAVDFPKAG